MNTTTEVEPTDLQPATVAGEITEADLADLYAEAFAQGIAEGRRLQWQYMLACWDKHEQKRRGIFRRTTTTELL